MEERRDLSHCGICGHEVEQEQNYNLCRSCEDAWQREVDTEW